MHFLRMIVVQQIGTTSQLRMLLNNTVSMFSQGPSVCYSGANTSGNLDRY